MQEYTDRIQFKAPETGYETESIYSVQVDDPNFSIELNKLFFVKLRNGAAYGRIEIKLIGLWNDGSAIDMKSWVNPRASRNLEFNPKLQPLPPRW